MNHFKYVLILLFISSSFEIIAQDTPGSTEPQKELTKTDSLENPVQHTFVFNYPYKPKELPEAYSLQDSEKNTSVFNYPYKSKELPEADSLQDSEKKTIVFNYTNKSEDTTVIAIGALNVPRGAVRVSAGDQQLLEGIDYTVNYQAGTVQILDPSWQASNVPIKVSVEK